MAQSLIPIAFDANAINHRKHNRIQHRKKYVFDTTVKTNSVDQIFSLATVDFWVMAIAVLFCPNCYFLRLHVHKSCAYMITQTQTKGLRYDQPN